LNEAEARHSDSVFPAVVFCIKPVAVESHRVLLLSDLFVKESVAVFKEPLVRIIVSTNRFEPARISLEVVLEVPDCSGRWRPGPVILEAPCKHFV